MEPIYPLSVCPQRFRFTHQQHPVAMPCCWNHPIDQPNPQINRAIIVVHGVLRNADEYYPNMLAAVQQAGQAEHTLVIAPQFLVDEDLERFDLSDEVPYWGGESGEGWKRGDDSVSLEKFPRRVTLSAFEVVDRLVERVADPQTFPNLTTVVIAGHSAGGQYLNRYAAGTAVEQTIPAGIRLRFIVANPSTYVYLNPERQIDADGQFGIPPNADPDYDDYKYGLNNLNPYMAAAGAEKILAEYPEKDVVYLLGGEDTREAMLEQTPNAALQGKNRLERGQVYYRYLQHLYGEKITQTHKIAIIPCVGHDNAAIWQSEAGLRYLLG